MVPQIFLFKKEKKRYFIFKTKTRYDLKKTVALTGQLSLAKGYRKKISRTCFDTSRFLSLATHSAEIYSVHARRNTDLVKRYKKKGAMFDVRDKSVSPKD